MSIECFRVRNFNIFKDLHIRCAKGVNVIIGENGTGKTQLLKLLYSNHSDEQIISQDIFHNKGFLIELDNIQNTMIECDNNKYPCVFIPGKDMMTHAKGFSAMYDKYKEFPFDRTYPMIIDKVQRWTLQEIPQLAKNIIPRLEKMIDGTIVVENNDFYVKKSTGKLIKFDTEAEGLKKIGLIWQLLMNESITKDTILFWDEPEAFINPKFIPELVEIFLELSRHDIQIFVTTHDYIFAKYFEIKRKSTDEIQFHSLYSNHNQQIQCETQSNFKDLKHNTIMDIFIQLYKDEVERAMQ
ncbi:MAG: AAA family ATPase [Cellulosilyticaceae bacterium]